MFIGKEGIRIMKQYIIDNSTLTCTNPKIKVYESVECADEALACGCLAEGEIIATKFIDAAGDITVNLTAIADCVNTISSYIPSDTDNDENKLVNQCMLTEATGGSISVYCNNTCKCSIDTTHCLCLDKVAYDGVSSLETRVCTLENTTIPDLCSCVTTIQTDICCLQCDVSDLDTCVQNIEAIVDDPTSGLTSLVNELSTSKVDCSDYNTCVACLAQCCDLPVYTLSGTTLTITL